ncbi:interleukin-32-like isoform X1 [Myotis yumanensis]|uniref:interleukin-32-like isoform X1 n=2 Tax=Myotis yumanensis TaxID=159337 RepID=UPI0038CF7DE0
MACLQTSQEDREKMRREMLKAIDTFCDKVKSKEENQVHICLKELEISFNEALFDTLLAHYENYNQTSKDDIEEMRREMKATVNALWDGHKPEEEEQESTPLLPDQQQELRNRVRSRVRPGQKPGPDPDPDPDPDPEPDPDPDPEPEGAQQPGESFCEWIMRLFQKMLRRLKKMWKNLLAWVQEKWASFVSVVKYIWSEIKDFCFSAAKCFSSLFQF